MKTQMNVGLHNRFDIEVIRNGEVVQRVQAENIILNALWGRLLTPATYFNYIAFGSGTGTPAAADTSLFTHLGMKAVGNPTIETHFDDGYVSARRMIQLAENEYVDSTLTEVGIAYSSSASSLVTHALLKDMNGNAITITKTNVDLINIYATVFVHWAANGYGNGIKIAANTANEFLMSHLTGIYYNLNPSNVFTTLPNYLLFKQGFEDGAIQNGTTNINAGRYYIDTVTPTYNIANRKISYSYRLAVANANFGIRSISLCNVCTLNSKIYTPVINIQTDTDFYSGTPIAGEEIGTGNGTTTDFKTSFAFVKSGAKIYVNGVEQSFGVTVDLNLPPENNQMGQYFIPVSDNSQYRYGPSNTSNKPASAMQFTQAIAGYGIATQTYDIIYYNPYYLQGIKTITKTGSAVCFYVSDDMETWDTITPSSTVYNIPAEYQHKKYWKVSSQYAFKDLTTDTFTEYNIHFDTPPASGDIITADYTTASIAKDENHVFDFTCEIQLGERTS